MDFDSMLNRAYSFLNVKSVDGEKRTITGVATTPTPDRMGDVVEPLGVTFKNPLPLLLYHNSQKPVGWVKFQKPTKNGIDFEAQLPTIDEPGTVRDRIEEAWTSIKSGLLAGVSIGFRTIEEAYNKELGGFRILQSEVLELSLVAIPAQPDARIETIKSLDVFLPASGTEDDVADDTRPAPRASTRVITRSTGSRMAKKTYAEQITQWENTRAAKAARQDEIQTKASDESRAKDEAEAKEFADLDVEIKDCDTEIADLRRLESREKEAAKPVAGKTQEKGSESRTGLVRVSSPLPKGIGFARMAMCVMKAKGNEMQAMEYAKQFYPDDSALHGALRVKAAVGAGAALTSHWADDLVPYNILQNEFIEYLRPGSIVGKFGGPNPGGGNYPSLNRVPFNVRTSGFSSGLTGYWVQEGLPIPLSKAVSFTTTLTWAKVGGICALTQEEVRFSNPAAEAKVRDELARALNARVDIDFVDPAKAAVANVSPASITDSIAATAPSGTAATNVRKDLATLMALFAANNLDPTDLVLIMSGSMAAQISMMVNTLGNDDFPNLSLAGGTLRGIPVIVSEYLTSVGSPSTQTIIMVKASDIYLADDGAVTIDGSSEASVEMLDASLQQSGISGTGASLVSAFQSGLLFLKAQREITWKVRRSTAVQYISPAAYVAA